MARESWTDERLDDLNAKVGRLDQRLENGFTGMREELRAVRSEMTAQNRMIVQLFGGMFATMLIGFLAVIAAIFAHG